MAQPNRFSPGAGQGMRGTFGSPPPQTVNTPRPSGLPAPPTGGPTTYNPDLSQTSGPLPYQTQSYIKAEEEMENTNKLDPIVDEDGGMNWAAMLLGGAAAGMAAFGGGNLRAIGQLAGAGIAGGVSGVAASAAINLEREEKEEIRRAKDAKDILGRMMEAYRSDLNEIGDDLANKGFNLGYWTETQKDSYVREGTLNREEFDAEEAEGDYTRRLSLSVSSGNFSNIKRDILIDGRLSSDRVEHWQDLIEATEEVHETTEYRKFSLALAGSKGDRAALGALLADPEFKKYEQLFSLATQYKTEADNVYNETISAQAYDRWKQNEDMERASFRKEMFLWGRGDYHGATEERIRRELPAELVNEIFDFNEKGGETGKEEHPKYTEVYNELRRMDRSTRVSEAMENAADYLVKNYGLDHATVRRDLRQWEAILKDAIDSGHDEFRMTTEEQAEKYANEWANRFLIDVQSNRDDGRGRGKTYSREEIEEAEREARKKVGEDPFFVHLSDEEKEIYMKKVIEKVRKSYRPTITLSKEDREAVQAFWEEHPFTDTPQDTTAKVP